MVMGVFLLRVIILRFYCGVRLGFGGLGIDFLSSCCLLIGLNSFGCLLRNTLLCYATFYYG